MKSDGMIYKRQVYMQSNNSYVQYLSLGLLLLLVGGSLCDDERLQGWNKAHGLWGKRSMPQQGELFNNQQKRPENWSKLNTLWGKRSEDTQMNRYAEWQKRFVGMLHRLVDPSQQINIKSQPNFRKLQARDRAQWQMANGLWGR